MKVFSTSQIREIDGFTIRNEPVVSTELMERAAVGCLKWIEKNIPRETPVSVFVGPGNNGGDGWALARLLSEQNYAQIQVFQLQINTIISPDAQINRDRLISQAKVVVHKIVSSADFPLLDRGTVIVDALFGSGMSRRLEGLSAELVNFLNHSGCRILAIDIPSGLMGEDNPGNPVEGIIKASDTITFQFPKRSFFYTENEVFVGRWHIIPIGLHPEILESMQTDYHYTTLADVKRKLIKRTRFSHKGTYGHALLVAGSYGMTGASILAARACLRAGVGLLTTHVPRAVYPIVQSSVPESIFSIDRAEYFFTQCPGVEKFSAVAAGPGIGTNTKTEKALEALVKSGSKALILDADALNLMAVNTKLLHLLPENTILTPHPGEFDRLFGKAVNGYTRNQSQISLSVKHKIVIVLKGAFTSISLSDGRCFFNSTGNPGMATAGSGDVLTGIILSLLAQGYPADDAAIIGTFIHGLAGDMAAEDTGQHSLIASDIIQHLGMAFKNIEQYETV
jgi:NAD(P)H-hydrate epimerase